jgi:hypothetical protein
MSKPLDTQELPPLDEATNEMLFISQARVAYEYGTDWDGLVDRLNDPSSNPGLATDVLMDLSRTDAALDQRERQLSAALSRLSQLEKENQEAVQALKDMVYERDTELDMMTCVYARGTSENKAWHDGVFKAWRRLEISRAPALKFLRSLPSPPKEALMEQVPAHLSPKDNV